MIIREYLKRQNIIFDGAMGTYYADLKKDCFAISEYANKKDPDRIEQIHLEYIKAGATIIRTNTFAANREALHVTKEEQRQIIEAGYQIASKAVKKGKKDVLIAANIGPISKKADREEKELLKEYQFICDCFLEQQADIILFETFSDLKYIELVAKYIKSKKSDSFIMTNFCLNKNGYTNSGISASSLLEQLSFIDEIEACGFNCGISSRHMYQILKNLRFPKGKFKIALPNAAYPEQLQNRMVFMDNINYFKENMNLIKNLGIDMLGGCCGTTPDYIRVLSEQDNITKKVDTSILKEERSILSGITVGESQLGQVYTKEEIAYTTNKFYELLQSKKKVIAVELDPPFDGNDSKIMECAHALVSKKVDIITIADSPMGRSRVDSILISAKVRQELEILVMPHVCCRDKNMIAMRSSLLGAYIHNIRNLLVVTGDPVPSENRSGTTAVFDYNSYHLMDFITKMNEEHFREDPIVFGGALNYGRGNIEKVIERMERKIEVGAKYFLTQPIYAKEDIEKISYLKERVKTKILCGIMPLVSYRNANFIKNEITGIYVPDQIVRQYHVNMSKEEAEWVGAAITNEIIEQLNPFADGYYFMLPFNRVSLMDKIIVQ